MLLSCGAQFSWSVSSSPCHGFTWQLIIDLQAASTVWAVVGFIVFLAKPEYRDWLVPLQLLFDSSYVLAFLWQYVLVVILGLSASHCVSNSLQFSQNWLR
jgi:hypothetical protein